MKRALFVLSILAAMAVAVGLAWSYDLWKSALGGGEVVREERTLPPFNRIAIEGFGELLLVQGSTESASIEAVPALQRSVRLEVTDGMLTIANPEARRWWLDFLDLGAKPVRVTVTYRTLNAISVSGAVKLRADRLATDRLAVSASGAASVRIGELQAEELTVTGSGALKMDVAGRTVSQRIRLSGAGSYRAAKLDSETAKVTVSGAGRVVVRAQQALAIDLSGAGSVEYFGNPRITQDIRGVGRVKRGAAD